MKVIAGILVMFLGVYYFSVLLDEAMKRNAHNAARIVELREQQEKAAAAPQVVGDASSVANAANLAEKIAADAPFVREALKESDKPIPPAQITAMHHRETNFCPGEPVQKCPCSAAGACTPMQLMPATIEQFAKPGENPETLLDSMKIAVRHLRFAKNKKSEELDPASDAAILRYNASSVYLKEIRDRQAMHEPIWASIQSGNGPVLAQTAAPVAAPAGYEVTSRGNFFKAQGNGSARYFPANPLRRSATWISPWGDRRNHGTEDDPKITPHGGNDFGCRERDEDILSICDGTVEVAAVGNDGMAGKMVSVVCDGGLYKASSMHLESFAVSKGQRVTAGQRVGGCGNSGNAGKQPVHDHFQLAKRSGNGWINKNPCIPEEAGDLVLHCNELYKDARLNPIRDVYVAKNP